MNIMNIRHRDRRLSPEQVARVVAFPRMRGSGRALAREFGVSGALISQIRNHHKYRDASLQIDWGVFSNVTEEDLAILSNVMLAL